MSKEYQWSIQGTIEWLLRNMASLMMKKKKDSIFHLSVENNLSSWYYPVMVRSFHLAGRSVDWQNIFQRTFGCIYTRYVAITIGMHIASSFVTLLLGSSLKIH